MYFTTLKVEKGIPQFLNLHLDHFLNALKRINICPPLFPYSQLRHFLNERSSFEQTERLNLLLTKDQKWTFKIKNEEKRKLEVIDLGVFPFPFYEKKPFLKKEPFTRHCFLEQAACKNLGDWIFLDNDQQLLETIFANVFWIKEKVLYFPDPSLPYYLGVTLTTLINQAAYLGLKTKPKKAFVEELFRADEVLYVNSMKGVLRVRKINNKKLKHRTNFCNTMNIELEKLAKEEGVFEQNLLAHGD